MASIAPPPHETPMQPPRRLGTPRVAPTGSRHSLFPPIPAPLQRLFDLVPLVVYPANALPGDVVSCDADTTDTTDTHARPTLFVFATADDAARGRPSFNPTCLKWQAFLRFAGVRVRVAPSSNHASPTGALPYLQPVASTDNPSRQTTGSRTRLPPPPRPVPTSGFAAWAKTHGTRQPADTLGSIHPTAPAYQSLLDTGVRRAWLHAVYLDQGPDDAAGSIAAGLYADAASQSTVVRAALTGQLQTAAAAEVWGAATTTPTATAVAHVYRDASVALAALGTVLAESTTDYFFGSPEPTLFDAAVFAYTHLLLEDGTRFAWRSTVLPDLVRAQPRLVQHREHIATHFFADAADPVDWVKV